MRKTKIVITLGPATDSPETVRKLIENGVNVFRLNFSHGDYESHRHMVEEIRAASQAVGVPVAILQDISGPKIRVGEIDEPMILEEGSLLRLCKEPTGGKGGRIDISHAEILDALHPGDPVYFADGTIRSEVVERDGEDVILKILVAGKLTTHKGVNFPFSKLNIGAITEKDRKDLAFGASINVDIVALSFVRCAEDVIEAREIIQEAGGHGKVFAKIEKPEAMENLEAILHECVGVMVARGDLGVELGLPRVPVAQKKIIQTANSMGKPVITATQMLSSMISSPYPTRAEVSDIANAVMDGTDAVMLSDETAVGNYPLEAVKTLDEVIREAETDYPYFRHYPDDSEAQNAIASAVRTLARKLKPAGVLVFTRSGASARHIAKYRPDCPIYVTTPSEETFRELSVSWGVKAIRVFEDPSDTNEMIYHFIDEGVKLGDLDPTKTYIATMGYPSGRSGTTNMIRVIDPEGMKLLQKLYS